VLEYLMAGALAESSVHIGHSGLLLLAAGVFALLALTARGPLGLARLCGARLHRSLDVVVAVALAAAPILPALRPAVAGIVVMEVAAVAWVRVATLTRYAKAAGGPADAVAGPDVRDGEPTGLPAPSAAAPGQWGPRAAVVARGLGILAGRSARRLPEAEEKLRGGARQAGRHAARLHQAWRKPPD